MSDGGVCRTAPATPGLFKILQRKGLKGQLIHLVSNHICKDWMSGVHKIFSKDIGFGSKFGLFFHIRDQCGTYAEEENN